MRNPLLAGAVSQRLSPRLFCAENPGQPRAAQDGGRASGRGEAWVRGGAWARGPSGARRARGGLGGGGCCERSWSCCLRRRRPGLSPSRTAARCGLVMATNQRPFHLVVVGASGFTGQFVTEEVAREQLVPDRGPRLPWAVAGRSREKLQRVLERAALKLGKGAEESRLRCAPQIQEPRPLPRSEREAGREQFVASPPALARGARKAELRFPGEASLRPAFGAGGGRLRAVLISCGAPASSFLEMLAERVLA